MIPRSRVYAARGLSVLCALAIGLGLLFIATADPSPAGGTLAQPAPTTAPTTAAPPTVAATTAPAPERGRATAAVAAAEAAADPSAQVGVAVLDRLTGELAVGPRGDEPFYTASLSKVVVVVDMLDRRQSDGLVLDDQALALVRRALGPSDDSAMNALWSRFDGQGAAGRVSARLGLTGTTAPKDPSQWGEMAVPAEDMVRIWQYVLDEAPAADRDLLISAMAAAPATGRDGFDQSFGLLAPDVRGPDDAVAKQGWMCCLAGKRYLHTAGALGPDRRYLTVFLTRIPRAGGWDAARRDIDGMVEAAVAALQ